MANPESIFPGKPWYRCSMETPEHCRFHGNPWAQLPWKPMSTASMDYHDQAQIDACIMILQIDLPWKTLNASFPEKPCMHAWIYESMNIHAPSLKTPEYAPHNMHQNSQRQTMDLGLFRDHSWIFIHGKCSLTKLPIHGWFMDKFSVRGVLSSCYKLP